MISKNEYKREMSYMEMRDLAELFRYVSGNLDEAAKILDDAANLLEDHPEKVPDDLRISFGDAHFDVDTVAGALEQGFIGIQDTGSHEEDLDFWLHHRALEGGINNGNN